MQVKLKVLTFKKTYLAMTTVIFVDLDWQPYINPENKVFTNHHTCMFGISGSDRRLLKSQDSYLSRI